MHEYLIKEVVRKDFKQVHMPEVLNFYKKNILSSI